MSLIRKKTLIGLCCAAALLDLDESSIRKGLCGTDSLTKVRRGNGKRQRVSLVLEEVIELRATWIDEELKKREVRENRPQKGKLIQFVK